MSSSSSKPRDSADGSGRMAGEYQIGRKLGEGGFGAVYEAEHPVLKRRAAVKVLHHVAESDSQAVLRFVAEAQAVNQIRTRHIVDIFSFGKLSDGRHFYVMDLLDGLPLDRFLRGTGKLSLPLVLQILEPIASALDRAHAAGIVHRDLKPQNIFLSWDANGETVPVLLDFGVAKLMGDSPVRTISGTPIGTPLYMSPEQARGSTKVDGRADVYALGVLCHELLTGTPPIQGESTVAVLMAHIAEAPPRASAHNVDLPASIDAPILDMLHKHADARPATAGAALAALRTAAEAAGITVPSGLPRLARPEPGFGEKPGEQAAPLASTIAWSDAHLERERAANAGEPVARSLRRSGTRSAARRTSLWVAATVALSALVGAYYLWGQGAEQPVTDADQVRVPLATETAQPDTRPASPEKASAATATAQEEAPATSQPPPSPTADHAAVPAAAPAPIRATEPRKRKPEKQRDDSIPSDLESPF